MSAAPLKRPGLKCEKCDLPFSLTYGLGGRVRKKIELLSDPFEAECPICGHRATYPKSAIHTIPAVVPR